MKSLKLPNLNRLFWKIFLSLWLSSAVVMLVTMLVIAELAERDSFEEKVKYQVRSDIERLLNYYENNPDFQRLLKRKQRRELAKKDWQLLKNNKVLSFFNHRKNRPPVRIYDDKGRLLVGNKNVKSTNSLTFDMRSESDQKYTVEIDLKHPDGSFKRWQGFIFSLQALLIFISSTLASFIISAIVVRPINQLRRHVARLHSGDFSQRTAQVLQRRGDEIGDFARELNQMAEYVEKTLIGQQNLFQNVSHELRAPLARLMAASGIIEQQVGIDHPAVNRVQIECERLTLLIDELLSLAKLDQQQHSNQPVLLQPLLDKLINDSQYLASHDQSISLEFSPDVTAVLGSSTLLERALGNVLHNALKYSGELALIEIKVSQAANDQVIVEVMDNGPGVPEHTLAKLCDPFFRLDINVEGHGLGLGIAKQAIHMQGGVLTLSNRKPQGLCAKIVLKAHPEQ